MDDIMNNGIILAADSTIYKTFEEALDKRMVFFAGLSGVGKSLYIQQFSQMAANAGRTIHLLQWDVTREAFQSEEVLAKYPEIGGVTHPMIRKAVGVWTRQGIAQWHKQYPEAEHILIGELPLIGNRLMEIVQQHSDEVEPLLESEQAQFFLPVPSTTVRQHIIGCRTSTIDQPSHEREAADAPPDVVNQHWQEIRQFAVQQGLVDSTSPTDYDPTTYTAAYMHLLQHRNAQSITVDEVLDIDTSVYVLGDIASEIAASKKATAQIYDQLESQYTLEQVQKMTDHWYQV
jgi:hypothetical protein